MKHLIYCSRSENIDTKGVKKIIENAQIDNKKRNISGVLFYNHQYFLQILEGSTEDINYIYHQKIANDKKHWDLRLISYRAIEQRQFAEWYMGMASEKKVNSVVYFQFGMEKEFYPYALREDNAADFLLTLKNTAKIFASQDSP